MTYEKLKQVCCFVFFYVGCTGDEAVGAEALMSVKYFDGSAKGWLLQT